MQYIASAGLIRHGLEIKSHFATAIHHSGLDRRKNLFRVCKRGLLKQTINFAENIYWPK